MTTIIEEPFRSYRVPREHGGWLIDPPLEAAAEVLAANVRRSGRWDLQIAGQPIAEFRQRARRELLSAAIRYVSTYRDPPNICATCPTDRPLILAGHQPELFHPGVWFKNFVLSQLGTSLAATSINLVVDNDICRTRSIRVPTIRGREPATETVAFDRPTEVVPYEMAGVTDCELFRQFARRVSDTIKPLQTDPCVRQLWPHAVAAADRTDNLGLALAQSRHQLESRVGLSTLEVPLSELCGGEAFCTFVVHLISDLPRLHDCYNQSVIAYRKAHHIRSNSHPVPELARRGEWYEAPLWIYDAANPQRRALFVRVTNQQIELSDLEATHLKINGRGPESKIALELMDRLQSTFRLRPRALVTTMYARLVLSDLFLHGIGGGKYDQLNDTIIRRFFAVDPPQFTVLSATFTPLGETFNSSGLTANQIRQSLRRTRFQPECFAGDADLPVEPIREKRDLLNRIPPRGSKRAWHDRMTEINQTLSDRLDDVRRQLADQLQDAGRREAQRRLLASREYSFCLYRLEEMVEMFGGIAGSLRKPVVQGDVAHS